MAWPYRWSVLYTEKIHKKNPSWNDGEVHIHENLNRAILVDSDFNRIGPKLLLKTSFKYFPESEMLLEGLKIKLDRKLIGSDLERSLENSTKNQAIYLSCQTNNCRKARTLYEMDGTVTMKHPYGENETSLPRNNEYIEKRSCSQEFKPPRIFQPCPLQDKRPVICNEETHYTSKRRRIQQSTVTIEEID